MDEKKIMWRPDFKWHKIDLEAYRFIYEEAEKKLVDVLEEAYTITNRSIKFAFATATILSILIGLVIENHFQINCGLIIIIVFYVCNIVLFTILIFPKDVIGEGFLPSDLIPKELDSDKDKKHQEHLLYYSAIVKKDFAIEKMILKNNTRIKIYKIATIILLVNIILSLIYLASEELF